MFSNIGQVTLQLVESAAGRVIPPMLCFQKLSRNAHDSLPNEWNLTVSKNGYTDRDLFLQSLEKFSY